MDHMEFEEQSNYYSEGVLRWVLYLCIIVFAFVVFYKDDTIIRLLTTGMVGGVIFMLSMKIHISHQQLIIQSPAGKKYFTLGQPA
jgi:hypothetical protein